MSIPGLVARARIALARAARLAPAAVRGPRGKKAAYTRSVREAARALALLWSERWPVRGGRVDYLGAEDWLFALGFPVPGLAGRWRKRPAYLAHIERLPRLRWPGMEN